MSTTAGSQEGSQSGPQGSPPLTRFARHDPKLEKISIDQAKDFYQWDKQLTIADRRKLSSYFWQKMAFYPLLGLPVLYGFIISPRILQKRGVLNPKRSYKLLQVGLGFIGLGVGFQIGNGISSLIQMQLLKGNEPAYNAYNVLRKYPPQLGSRYFQMTAVKPELALKNPETIDWKSNPLFPVVLVMNEGVVQEIKKLDKERVDGFEEKRRAQTQRAIERREKSTGGTSPELTGTSWDHIIEQNKKDLPSPTQNNNNNNNTSSTGNSSYSNSSYSNSSYSSPSFSSPSFSSPSFSSPSFSSPSSSSGFPSSPDGISEEQRRFDEMLEKERAQQVQDDFSENEKKWD